MKTLDATTTHQRNFTTLKLNQIQHLDSYLFTTGVPRDRFLHKTILIITMAINVMAAITAITIHNVFSLNVRFSPPLARNSQDNTVIESRVAV